MKNLQRAIMTNSSSSNLLNSVPPASYRPGGAVAQIELTPDQLELKTRENDTVVVS